MDTTQLFLNEQLITLKAEPDIIKKLNEEDDYLSEYINKATKMGQFDFLFKDPTLKKIVVRRATTTKPVWNRKGKANEDDLAATSLLLKLRASDKYAKRFTDKFAFRNKLWEEVAAEIRSAGFEVDGPKCAQKFLNLSKSYYRYKNAVDSGHGRQMATPEFYDELHAILVNIPQSTEDQSMEAIGNFLNSSSRMSSSPAKRAAKRRKKTEYVSDDDEEDGGGDILAFMQKHFKQKKESKDEKYEEMLTIFKERTGLMKQKLEQNERIISLLENLVDSGSSSFR